MTTNIDTPTKESKARAARTTFYYNTQKVQDRLQARHRVYINGNRLEETSQEQSRLALNNEEKFPTELRYLEGNAFGDREDYSLNPHSTMLLWQKFAESGDPLGAAVVQYMNGLSSEENWLVLLHNNHLLERIMNRRISRKEYEGLVNGDRPLATKKRLILPDKEYRLPKLPERFVVP